MMNCNPLTDPFIVRIPESFLTAFFSLKYRAIYLYVFFNKFLSRVYEYLETLLWLPVGSLSRLELLHMTAMVMTHFDDVTLIVHTDHTRGCSLIDIRHLPVFYHPKFLSFFKEMRHLVEVGGFLRLQEAYT